MLALLIQEGPLEQLFMGAFLLMAGLFFFPLILSFLMPAAEWMNSGWSHHSWWQTAWRITRGFMVFACSYFVLLGAAKLSIYCFVRAGMLNSPWQ